MTAIEQQWKGLAITAVQSLEDHTRVREIELRLRDRLIDALLEKIDAILAESDRVLKGKDPPGKV